MNRFKPVHVLLVLFIFSTFVVAATSGADRKIIVAKHGGSVLGVVVTDAPKETLEENKISGGALILDVVEDTEAERIGIAENDIITKFNSADIKNADDLREQVDKIDSAQDVTIEVVRDAKKMSFTAKLEPSEEKEIDVEVFGFDEGADVHPDHDYVPGAFKFKMDNSDFAWKGNEKGGFLGVHAENISEDMLGYFEVEHGVLVKKVVEDSPADKAGFKAGDVITKIDDRKIKDYADLIRTLNYYNPEEKVKVAFSRKGSTKGARVTLGEKPEKEIKKIIKRRLTRPMKFRHKDGDVDVKLHKLEEHLEGLDKSLQWKDKKGRKIYSL